jgi:predicted nucleotidyltransferase
MGLPKELQADVSRAAAILRSEGCREVYLFGSITRGTFSTESDLDIATIGLSKDKFFRAYGRLLSSIDRPIDLVALDYDTDFGRRLRETGTLTRVA